MRIAVVIEPLDGSRQVHSEAGLSFTLAGEALSKVFQNVEILHFSGIRATKLLDGLSREDWDALVFASNSIRHRDGAVWSAFEAHGQKISRFVEAGGGLLVLHQFDSNLGSLSLPDGLHIGFGHRDVVKNSRTLTSENEDELLLNFPFTVNLGEEFAKGGSQLADLLSWMECDFPEGALSKVLSMGSKQTVLARSSDVDVHRVVLSALPLDWHGAIKLLGNALTFVASGPPRQIVWSLESRPLQLAYNPEGVDIGVFELNPGALGEKAAQWARDAGVDQLFSGSAEEEISTTRGLSLFVSEVDGGRLSFHGECGIRPERQLEHELVGVDFSQIGSNYVQHPYTLRNIVTSLVLSSSKFPEIGAWNPARDREFKERFISLEFEQMTITSALASLQTALALKLGSKTTFPILTRIDRLSSHTSVSGIANLISLTVRDSISFDDFLDGILEIAPNLPRTEVSRAVEWVAFFRHFLDYPCDSTRLAKTVNFLVDRLAEQTSDGNLELSIDDECALVMALVSSSDFTSEQSNNALRASLKSIQQFLGSQTAPEQISLRLRASVSVALVREVLPNPVEEVKAGLLHIALDDRDWRRKVEPIMAAASSTSLSEQVNFLTQQNSNLRNELKDKHSIWALGAVFSWMLWLGVTTSLFVAWLQIFRFEAFASIFAIPLGLAALWVVGRLMLVLDRNRLTPRWLSILIKRVPWFKSR